MADLHNYGLIRFSKKTGKIDTTMTAIGRGMIQMWALQNTTNFAGPMQSRSAVFSAASRTICPIRATASILMPALVEPMFTEEQI